MGIRKSRGSRFFSVHSSYRMAKGGINKANRELRQQSGEGDEKGNPQVPYVNPSPFLNRKEKKAWERLPDYKKQKFIDRAIREAEKKGKGNARRPPVEKRTAEEFRKQGESRKKAWRQEKGEERKNQKETMQKKVSTHPQDKETVFPKESSVKKLSSSSGKGKVPLPVSARAGFLAAKKTAEYFKEQNRRKNAAVEGRRMQIQSELSRKMDENREMGSLGQKAAFTAAAMASVVLTVATAAIQFAATIVLSMFAILVPIVAAAVIASIVAAFLAGIVAALNTAGVSGSGEDIVIVAAEEIGYREGAGSRTKYGAYTGADGAAWCHSFVSWCANECGFIKMGIIPKTASCEEGRQWFIRHQKYQKKEASYIPQPGDIIYFDFDGAGESHHVGIVEYAENDVVHTIEGNKQDQVMRGHYPLHYHGIMGYGQPDYPDTGIDLYGSAQQFLTECDRVSSIIVNDGNWIYSNSRVEGSFEKARNASVRKTNCAHYVSLVMQEFGTLKKGQFIYSNEENKLVASSRVKKQIEKYYDVISVGGKMASDADLKPGDICLYHLHTNVYAGKNREGKMTWYDLGRSQTSDHKENSGYFVRSKKTGNTVGGKIYTILRLKAQDSYGAGESITIPEGLGDVYSYMGWSLITNRLSRQYRLRVSSGEKYDANGFGKIGTRYVVACTTTFGEVGDEVDFVLANGRVIHSVIGEVKSQSDPDCNKWGHEYGHCIVEFCVNKESWYGTGKTVTRFHPEWGGTRVKKAINLGNNHLK